MSCSERQTHKIAWERVRVKVQSLQLLGLLDAAALPLLADGLSPVFLLRFISLGSVCFLIITNPPYHPASLCADLMLQKSMFFLKSEARNLNFG